MNRLLAHWFQKHVVPVLLLPVFTSGFFCVAVTELPNVIRRGPAIDRIMGAAFSMLGLTGTCVTLFLIRAICRGDPTWRIFELGRTAWAWLLGVAWLLGLGCGIYVCSM